MSKETSKLFFTGDHHIGHGAILKHCNRPFKDLEDMKKCLIERWNAKVPVDADVMYLGDVAYRCSAAEIEDFFSKVNGKVFFLRGNHDGDVFENWHYRKYGSRIPDIWKIYRENQLIFMSHYAHRVWDRSHFGSFHLYAHSHGCLPDLVDQLSMDVGVDANPDYAPFSWDEVKDHMSKKLWVPPHGKDLRFNFRR